MYYVRPGPNCSILFPYLVFKSRVFTVPLFLVNRFLWLRSGYLIDVMISAVPN